MQTNLEGINFQNNNNQIEKVKIHNNVDARYLISKCIDYRTQHFEWHCQYIHEHYLKNWHPRAVEQNSNYTAVIIENRCHPLLEFAIKNTLFIHTERSWIANFLHIRQYRVRKKLC